MQSSQLGNFLRIHYVNGLGRVSIQKLAEQYDFNFDSIVEAGSGELTSAGLNHQQIAQIKQPDLQKIEEDLEWAQQPHNYLIPFFDADYPVLLKETADFPPLLYASGNKELLNRPQIAIVGSRNCSPGGAKTAFQFASYLSNSGITITSGMATGIDTQAHLGALKGNGATIAVTGTGLDRIYPSKNRQLAYEIHQHGLLVSE